ncbi:MAG: S-adenosylmethionine decarboxylase proenzyme [Gammaproteobacteria bacterium]|nr:S-adenosylmethionine decarboxylase proenzyme [Gammaproteobacteria bacterium]
MTTSSEKICLQGFNNLTKTLSFNIYDVCYARTEAQMNKYMQYIDEAYNSDRLTQILEHVSKIIGANILNIAKADYDPLGASVTLLISEEGPSSIEVTDARIPGRAPEAIITNLVEVADTKVPGRTPEAVVAHLDKSHLTVHTYPESHPDFGICSFRADIDVSTCGTISPLKALNALIHCFESDIVIMDYRVRGFTRDTTGTKHYIDHEISSIQNFIAKDIKRHYQMIDVNIYEENIFHTKMMLKKFDLNNYLFNVTVDELEHEQRLSIEQRLKEEMAQIFYGSNSVTTNN